MYPLTSADVPKHLLPVAGIPSIVRLVRSLLGKRFPELVLAIGHADRLTLDALASREDFALVPKEGEGDGNGGDADIWTLEHRATAATTTTAPPPPRKITVLKLSDDCSGSGDAVRQIEARELVHPKARVVVIPGDLVILKRDLDWDALIRPRDDSACTALLVDVGEVDEHGIPLKESAKAKKGGLGRDEEDIEYIGLSCPRAGAAAAGTTPRIVLKGSKLDVEADEDMTGSTAKLDVPKSRLRGGGGVVGTKLVVRTEWSDVHVYSLAPWVRDLLIERGGDDGGGGGGIPSLQSGLLPLLISRQFRGRKATYGSSLPDENDENDKGRRNSDEDASKSDEPYSVSALVLESKTVVRINTIPAYLHACKESVANGGSELPMPADSKWNGKFLSLVLKGSTLGAKCNMKGSIVGANCQLGTKCRLNNVVIMDGVIVGENCSLQNTILGPGVVLGNNCSLNDCQVGPGMKIPAGTKEKGESFMVGDDIGAHDML